MRWGFANLVPFFSVKTKPSVLGYDKYSNIIYKKIHNYYLKYWCYCVWYFTVLILLGLLVHIRWRIWGSDHYLLRHRRVSALIRWAFLLQWAEWSGQCRVDGSSQVRVIIYIGVSLAGCLLGDVNCDCGFHYCNVFP